ncbi:UNVERIFIED_CONTAM: hypothetical protein K2H54_054513 [Gekko kuhli]
MNLNETEKMISTVEHFHNQPYFWDLLYSLPWLQKGRLSQERGIQYLSDLLHTIQNSLAFLEDLNVMPSNQRPSSLLKLGLTGMTAVLEAWNGEDFQYILCLGDIVWIPSVKTELESQLGFEKIYIERILSSTMMLNKVSFRDEGEEAEFCLPRTAKQRDRHEGLGWHKQYGGNTWERIWKLGLN